MKAFFVRGMVIVSLAVCVADANAASCPANLPAGVIIRVVPDETLTAGITSGPTILTVSSDVRFFPNRPPLIARGSKILGTIVESKKAGRFHGKARVQLGLTTILTADNCEYPIDGKVIEAGKHKVEDDVIWGRGHARRDLFALLFPPTTIYQLSRLPSRGPKLIVDSETPLSIKLMETVSLIASAGPITPMDNVPSKSAQIKVDAAERAVENPRPQLQVARVTSGTCSMAESTARALVQGGKVVRPVRNLTPYHVSIYLDRTPITILPPCYGPSMIPMPATEFRLEATASLVTAAGQRQVSLRVVPSPGGIGWDIVPTAEETIPTTTRAN